MPRYKTETRPGLVALYDIRPGNGAGLFLQPRSPHGAVQWLRWLTCTQQAWVQFPLVSIWIIGGSRKGIWPKLLPCASKVLSWYRYPGILVGMSEPSNNRVNKIKFRRNKRRQKGEEKRTRNYIRECPGNGISPGTDRESWWISFPKLSANFPPVLGHCWFGDRKGIPAWKSWVCRWWRWFSSYARSPNSSKE